MYTALNNDTEANAEANAEATYVEDMSDLELASFEMSLQEVGPGYGEEALSLLKKEVQNEIRGRDMDLSLDRLDF